MFFLFQINKNTNMKQQNGEQKKKRTDGQWQKES